MKRIVFTFGLISGGILATFMALVMVPMCLSGDKNFTNSAILGYTAMVLAFLAVFFGIRSYRDKNGGGAISFWKGVGVGLLITLVTCTIYVATCDIMYYNFVPDFADKYATLTIDKLPPDGASDAEIVKEQQKMDEFKRLYANPIFNIGMTYLEIFPVGLIMTLVSAAILRKKATPGVPQTVTA